MKLVLSLFSVVFLISCKSGSNLVYNPVLKKRVKVFENEDFKMYYPKSWVTFQGVNSDPVICLSPKKELYDAFLLIDTINGQPTRIIGNKEKKIKFEFHKNNIIQQNFKSSYATLSIEIDSTDKIETFIQKINQKAENNTSVNLELKKISDSFYILTSRNQASNRKNNFRFGAMILKSYVYSTPNKIYHIIYRANEYRFTEYLDEANFILKSFELK